MADDTSLITKVLYLAISLFIEAVILPPALVAIATATLTSVNPAIKTVFSVLVPIIAVIATVLLFLHTIRQEQ